MEALDAIEKVVLPEGSAGPWIVERFSVPSVRKGKPPFWRDLPVGTSIDHCETRKVPRALPHPSIANHPNRLCLTQSTGVARMKEARGIYRVRRIGGLGSDARVTDGATEMDVP
jgi:hypothetical protein